MALGENTEKGMNTGQSIKAENVYLDTNSAMTTKELQRPIFELSDGSSFQDTNKLKEHYHKQRLQNTNKILMRWKTQKSAQNSDFPLFYADSSFFKGTEKV